MHILARLDALSAAHKRIFAALGFILFVLPDAVGKWWKLYSNEPLLPILLKRIGVINVPGWALALMSWLSTTVGLFLLIAIFWKTRNEKKPMAANPATAEPIAAQQMPEWQDRVPVPDLPGSRREGDLHGGTLPPPAPPSRRKKTQFHSSEDPNHRNTGGTNELIEWIEETSGEVMGILIRNASVTALENLTIYAADFSEWSPSKNDFMQKSTAARLSRVVIRPKGDLQPSNHHSEFLPVVFTGKRDALCIIQKCQNSDKTAVAHDIPQPGIYRVVIEFTIGTGKAETLTERFVKWENGSSPEFTVDPRISK